MIPRLTVADSGSWRASWPDIRLVSRAPTLRPALRARGGQARRGVHLDEGLDSEDRAFAMVFAATYLFWNTKI